MNWAEKQIADLEKTRLDMFKAIQRAQADCRKPSANIVNLYDQATVREPGRNSYTALARRFTPTSTNASRPINSPPSWAGW